MKKIKNLLHNEKFWLLLVFLLGGIIRFWQLDSRQFFSYDQARDYLIIKKIIIDHKFTLVGPTVLAPGIFLPPFYYYSLIPFLWGFGYRLIGPDIYTALLGTLALGVFYLVVKDFFEKKTALVTSIVFAFNPYLVQSSRHAWNPNTIYLFTLLFFLAFERYLLQKKPRYLLLAAFCFSWALNLHYSFFVFTPLLIFLFFKELKTNWKSRLFWLSLVVFFIFISPLLAFELRHNFPNLKAFAMFVDRQPGLFPGYFLLERVPKIIVDLIKMPITLITGLNQEQNITINPSHILLFDQTSLLANGIFSSIIQAVKVISGLGIVSAMIFFLFKSLSGDKIKLRLLLSFVISGFLIRLAFPSSSFYFYH
ncbi:MAG: glycosyltransferase family 39 protein, partial [Patescibacteria group bacterium]|nr:glycosyltransferase family 39 protein [Patescibacteria group bacterium]